MPPPKVSSAKLHEPYEDYRYAELRQELSLRLISLPRRLTTRVNFIKLLRDWDKTNPTTSRASQTLTRRMVTSSAPMTSTRIIRARRGCRFRLINVLLSPDFNGRWGAMAGNLEVNQLWLDVHAAFVAPNSMLDALHFHDALFVNVTPNVILPHSALRLLQMWMEIVAMYRNAVAQATEAAAQKENTHSFFDFCAGRLDLLYLHMAMLLEPKLYKLILSDKIPVSDPLSRRRAKTSVTTAPTATNGKNSEVQMKARAHTTAKPSVSGKGKGISVSTCAPTHAATATTIPVVAATIPTTPSGAVAVETTVATYSESSRGPTQNPEMEEILTLAGSKAPAVTTTPPKTATANASKAGIKAKQTKPIAPPRTPPVQAKVQQLVGKGKTPSGARGTESVKEARQVSPSKQKPTAFPPKTKAASKPFHSTTSVGDKPVDEQMSSLGKRSREAEETAIVEVPSVSDIVPHSGKRMQTTTISKALAPRPTDMMLPPDEWDILESRLRKVNENIDRCHRGLASVEVNVSENYKQSLEADLRFYSAIKQRLQEQLLVVMQSGY